MEVANKKRGRETGEENENLRNGKKQEFVMEEGEAFKFSDSFPSRGVFEFPWEKDGNVITEPDEWKSDDIFNPMLVEGFCELEGRDWMPQIPSAAIEFPKGNLNESWPSKNVEMDGPDCIWSCVLSQPLFVETNKVSCPTLK